MNADKPRRPERERATIRMHTDPVSTQLRIFRKSFLCYQLIHQLRKHVQFVLVARAAQCGDPARGSMLQTTMSFTEMFSQYCFALSRQILSTMTPSARAQELLVLGVAGVERVWESDLGLAPWCLMLVPPAQAEKANERFLGQRDPNVVKISAGF